MPNISLPPHLRDKIVQGQAILFLGAGASKGATNPNGTKPLDGDQLRDAIADHFLNGSLKNRPLAHVAEMAKSESSLSEVQAFIATHFSPLLPAQFHLLIPEFRWFAIVTTNYDLVIERAYDNVANRQQRLRSIVRNGDRFSDVLADPNSLPYLKLHGCVNQIADTSFPLILASEEYAKFRNGRERLFRHFQDWALEHPILFCGYDITDPNISQVLFDIGDSAINRARYALVRPSITEIEQRYWESRRVSPINVTFEQFLKYLSDEITPNDRLLGSLISQSSTIQRWVQRGTLSSSLNNYLSQELAHVREDLSSESVSPNDFYRGVDDSWNFCSERYDAERRITDEILIDAILEQYLEKKPRFYAILGHAGSGKTVVMKRLAWNAAVDHDRLVFYLREGGKIREDLLFEVWNITQEPFVVFVDDCLAHSAELVKLLRNFKRYEVPCIVIGGARSNEWNVYGDDLDPNVEKTYELKDLSERELRSLLSRLEQFQCLGVLSEVPVEDRMKHLRVSAERQLLVALLEATHGKPFEEIVLDEYRNVTPAEARLLYLDVCTLHRFGVGVRAGLISRVSNIRFEYFEQRLLKPLEHVVRTYFDPTSRDNTYRTRHREIAKIVFEGALDSPEKKVEQVVRILSNMDVDYSSDEKAFGEMIRGRSVADAFADRNLGDLVYKAAEECGADSSYVFHQRAVFELSHPNGDLTKALSFIQEAERKSSFRLNSIRHTKANILRNLANVSNSEVNADRLREDAKHILKPLLKGRNSSYAFHTLSSILFDEIRERAPRIQNVDGDSLGDRVLGETVSEFEEMLHRGLQEHPGDEHLLTLESSYAAAVGQQPRAVNALEKAYANNPRSCFVAVALSKVYQESAQHDKAKNILLRCLEENPVNKQAHLRLALVYIKDDEKAFFKQIESHLRKSFMDGDSNYDAQFWFARHQFLYGDRILSRKYFATLGRAKLPPEYRNRKRGFVKDENRQTVQYRGTVTTFRENYCFVEVSSLGEAVFIHHSDFSVSDWDDIVSGASAEFFLAFGLRGPVGVKARLTA